MKKDIEQIIYLAGLIDGDGRVQIYKKKRTSSYYKKGSYQYRVSLNLTNCNREVIQFAQKVLGGSIITLKSLNRPSYRLYIQGHNLLSKKVLPCLIPYLRVKKRLAILGLKTIILLKKHKPYYKPNILLIEKLFQIADSLQMKRRVKT